MTLKTPALVDRVESLVMRLYNENEEHRQKIKTHEVYISNLQQRVRKLLDDNYELEEAVENLEYENSDRMDEWINALKIVKKSNADLRDELHEEELRGFSVYERLKEQNAEMKKVNEANHNGKLHISCSLKLPYDEQCIIYKSPCTKCPDVKKWVCMYASRFDAIMIKNEIHDKKIKNHDKALMSLRDLNKNLISRMKELRTAHANDKQRMIDKSEQHRRDSNKARESLNNYKRDFKEVLTERLKQQTIHQMGIMDIETKQRQDKLENTQKNLDILIDTYEKHNADINILKQYSQIEKFIESTCEERTGQKRNYKAKIYNNIYDFMGLHNIDKYTNECFGIPAVQFYKLWTRFKAKRHYTAHPEPDSFDIESVQKTVKELTKRYLD